MMNDGLVRRAGVRVCVVLFLLLRHAPNFGS
jgi:hypothetical protein